MRDIKCSTCGTELPRHVARWYEVVGWEQPREGGGTNHIADRRRTGKVRCIGCMSKIQSGVTPGQIAMEV